MNQSAYEDQRRHKLMEKMKGDSNQRREVLSMEQKRWSSKTLAAPTPMNQVCALFCFPFPINWRVRETDYGLMGPVGTQSPARDSCRSPSRANLPHLLPHAIFPCTLLSPMPTLVRHLPQAAQALNCTKSCLGDNLCCKVDAIAWLAVASQRPAYSTGHQGDVLKSMIARSIPWLDMHLTYLHNHPDSLVSNSPWRKKKWRN